MKRFPVGFLLLAVMLLLNSGWLYASVGVIEDTSASDGQDVSVVVGEVKHIESRWEDKVIYSYVTIFVIDVEKGQASLKNKGIVIKHLGGGVDGLALWRSDQPTFYVGEKARLRVREEKGRFVLVEGAQGKTVAEGDLQSIEARTAAGYKLFWFRPPGEWVTSSSRPGPDWYGPARWNDIDIPVEYYLNTIGTPSGITESAFIEYAGKCYQTWEDDPGSYIDYSYAGTRSDVAFGDNDGVNIFCWKDIDGSGGTLGLCNIWVSYSLGGYDSLRIIDSDVSLDTGDPWSADVTCPSDKLDIQNIGTHEVGHNVGLADIYDPQDSDMTMFGYASLGETKKRTLEAGDFGGGRRLYPVTFSYFLFFPNVADHTGRGWRTSISLQNPFSSAAYVTIQCFDDSGTLLNVFGTCIPAYGKIGSYARAFNLDRMFFGTIILSSNASIVGVAVIVNNANTMSCSYRALSTASSMLAFPNIADDTRRGWRTSVVLQNPSSSTAYVTTYCFDDSGTLLNTYATSIPAYGKIGAYARAFNNGNMFFGSIIVTSDVGLVGVVVEANSANTMANAYEAP